MATDVIDSEFVAAPAESVYAREVEGELILLDQETSELHLLDPIGTVVWQCFDGSATLGEIATDVAAVTGADRDTVLSDLIDLTTELHDKGLLASSPSSVPTDHSEEPDGPRFKP